MGFSVTIDAFEGPLDLMLYLIKDKKLDLFNLDIAELTEQYINYIDDMQQKDLDIAAEYLSELAGLIEFKSKRLLPRDKSLLEAEEPEDSEERLVMRLLEYKQYKDVSIELSSRFLERQSEVDIPASYYKLEPEDESELIIKNDIYDLIKAMSKLMLRHQQQNQALQVKVTEKELSVDQRIDQLRRYLIGNKEKFNIREIIKTTHALEFQIVTFLAVLDMIRMNELIFYITSDDAIILKGV